ncbi:hypothetical protein AVEN_184536-1 [Araneus ventricosus]|uniref:Uncharacterized protein n=1 Tax=Araneus ventricosus TaxID=182803 RepID=A0A4Y2JMD6_ARAVE|nr:hypothetical protein AVEN_184536-1 [Araneus ventricosus]
MTWWHCTPLHFLAHPYMEAIHVDSTQRKSIRYGILRPPTAPTPQLTFKMRTAACSYFLYSERALLFPLYLHLSRYSNYSPTVQMKPHWLNIQPSTPIPINVFH